jgi:hypothetical protein
MFFTPKFRSSVASFSAEGPAGQCKILSCCHIALYNILLHMQLYDLEEFGIQILCVLETVLL